MMKIKLNDRILTAYVLDELSPRKRRGVERALETDTVSRRIVEELQKTILLTGEAIKEAPEYSLLPEQRRQIIEDTVRAGGRSRFDYGFRVRSGTVVSLMPSMFSILVAVGVMIVPKFY